MTIPQFDQDMARIKATKIQHDNGYHLSPYDVKKFNDAVDRILQLMQAVNKKASNPGIDNTPIK